MKIIVALLQELLLVVLSYQLDKCRKEDGTAHFYIYNANVNITIYPCIETDTYSPNICEIYNYKDVIYDHPDIIDTCIKNNHALGTVAKNETGIYEIGGKQIFLSLCELQAEAELLENTLKSRLGHRQYSDGRHYNTYHGYNVFWIPNKCKEMNLMYNGYFEVWYLQNETKYIRDTQINLKLTERRNMCSSEIWKTDYDGIIVSTQHIQTRISRNLPQKYNSNFPHDCEIVATNDSSNSMVNESTTNPSTTLHNKNSVSGFKLTEKSNKGTGIQANNDRKINNLKISVQCLLFVLIILFLWYLFNVIVNFSSLRRVRKKRTSESRAYILYCLSQSLTNRYLYLDEWTNEKSEPKNVQSQQQLYESVE